MNLNLAAGSLANVRSAITSTLREREIFRFVASIDTSAPLAAIQSARNDVLRWAQNRSGTNFPPESWKGKSFEVLFGGRTTIAVEINTDATVLWSLRADDPDKLVPRRIWTTEISIGWDGHNLPQLSVRQIVSSPEADLNIDPHVPGFLFQIARNNGLLSNGRPIEPKCFSVRTEQDLQKVIDVIEDRSRRIPVILASSDERDAENHNPLLDMSSLARAVFGLAYSVHVPSEFTYELSDTFGRSRSVFHGGIRLYFPGFDSSSDPYEHTLFLADQIRSDSAGIDSNIRNQVAQESLKRTRVGHDVLSFASVRSASSRLEQESRVATGASTFDQLESARRRIEALEAEIIAAKAQSDQSFQTAIDEEDRAKLAEAQYNSARLRIQALEHALQKRGIPSEEDVDPPDNWAEFADWADKVFVGRLVLTPAARRGTRSPLYSDIATAAKSLRWLASECLDRLSNGGGTISNIVIEPGLENAPCGNDAFSFHFHDRKLNADWHVKSGGNTRDPSRCLRIYYAFDKLTQQIIVAEMPAHRTTSAS
jgi:hypothetical protein